MPVLPSFRQGLPESRSHGRRVLYIPLTWTPAFSRIKYGAGFARVTIGLYIPYERPAIGVLLCARKDDEVVEYALSRSLFPALIAEYKTQLPNKALLQAKLHEFYLQNAPQGDPNDPAGIRA